MPFQYQNPILSGFFPDPSCVHVNGKFYLVNSTFQFFPGISVQVSTDLVNWTQLPGAINRAGIIDLSKAKVRGACADGLFAASIRYHNGTFYIVCSNVSLDYAPTSFIVSSSNPESGNWSDPISVNFKGMDPSLFFDDDGKVYYQGAAFPEDPSQGMVATISQAEIDVSTGKFLSELRLLWQGTSKGKWPEGPHLYKRSGWYYEILAEGGTHEEHHVTVARSRSPWGPFEAHPQNPVLSNKGTSEYIQGVGHADIFQDNRGDWWAVALGVRVRGESFPLCRETFLCPVEWSEDNWPSFNGGHPIKTSMSVDRVQPASTSGTKKTAEERTISFRQNLPDLLYLRNPNPNNYAWQDDGSLALIGESATLDTELGTSTFVGVRQRHLDAEFGVKLEPTSQVDPYETGITVYLDNHRHLDLYLSVEPDSQIAELQLRTVSLRNLKTVQNKTAISVGRPICIGVASSEIEYTFRWRELGRTSWNEIGRVPSADISEWGFTGPLFGVYASAKNSGGAPHAMFSDIMYSCRES